MADEKTNDDVDEIVDETEAHPDDNEGDDVAFDGSGGADDGDAGPDVDDEDQDEGKPEAYSGAAGAQAGGNRITMSMRNLSRAGHVRLHFASRTVTLGPLDGDAALRLLFRVQRGRKVDWATDTLDPATSSADAGWFVLPNPDEGLLAAEWLPWMGSEQSPGIAIDPVV